MDYAIILGAMVENYSGTLNMPKLSMIARDGNTFRNVSLVKAVAAR